MITISGALKILHMVQRIENHQHSYLWSIYTLTKSHFQEFVIDPYFCTKMWFLANLSPCLVLKTHVQINLRPNKAKVQFLGSDRVLFFMDNHLLIGTSHLSIYEIDMHMLVTKLSLERKLQIIMCYLFQTRSTD